MIPIIRRCCLVLYYIVLMLILRGQMYGQFDPYSAINDPLSITKLHTPLNKPLRFVSNHGLTSKRDSIDGNFILASDSGSGVITHLWLTTHAVDSTTNLKIYIDGKLVIQSKDSNFFGNIHGLFRPPLNDFFPGAYICDVQMPYTKSFRITYTEVPFEWQIYYAIAWRPVSTAGVITRSFDPYSDPTLSAFQTTAESKMRGDTTLWGSNIGVPLPLRNTLVPKTETNLRTLVGPGYIRRLQIFPDSCVGFQKDSLWLKIYWDDEVIPSVSCPLSDFFMQRNDADIPVQCIFFQSKNGALWESSFPMPFEKKARIAIENRSQKTVTFIAAVDYAKSSIRHDDHGYFHAHFSEINPTRFHINHKVLSIKGEGRVVGLALQIPHNSFPSCLEGDPIITVDSNANNFIRYTGGEDYFNGGWWFNWGMFSRAFAGHTRLFQSFYRMQCLDALDFTKSFDFELQHGNNSDLQVDYRTVIYYYQKHIQFTVNRDTLRSGQSWHIAGKNYPPRSPITLTFDGILFAVTSTDSIGNFDLDYIIPASWKKGMGKLSVNEENYPQPITILSRPIIAPLLEYYPPVVRFGDTITIAGNGFEKNESIKLFFDSIPIPLIAPVAVDSNYHFLARAFVPSLSDRKYKLSVRAEKSGNIAYEYPIQVSRVLLYEFEDLYPTALHDSGWFWVRNLSERWFGAWSKQTAVQYEPNKTGNACTFYITVPKSDTFSVRMILSYGTQFGKYDYYLDGILKGHIDCYRKYDPIWMEPQPSDTLSMGVLYLNEGKHSVQLISTGKNDNSTNYYLDADILILTPTTKLPLSPGTIIDTLPPLNIPIIDKEYGSKGVFLFPNPVTDGFVIAGIYSKEDSGNSSALLQISLTDVLGRELSKPIAIGLINGFGQTKLNLSLLPSGDYYINYVLHSANGIQHFTRLLTKPK